MQPLPPPPVANMQPPPTVAEALASCRFCLRHNGVALRPLPIDQLAYTDIPELFETVAGVRLELSAGYSELMCTDCERHMRFVRQLRTDFRCVAQQWQTIRLGVFRGSAAAVKAEPPAEISEFAAVGFESNFVDCSLLGDADEVKLEPDGEVEANIDYDNGRVVVKYPRDDDDDSDDDRDYPDSVDYQAQDNSHRSSFDDDQKVSVGPGGSPVEGRRKRGRPPGSTFGCPAAGVKLTCDICGAQLSSKCVCH